MLYAGMPEPAGGDQGYSAYSIAATLAHEYQHAGRFSQKTYVRVLAGEDDPPVEDPAFDEAVSHFTESLVGLGLSGGNLLFAQKYLNQPSRYSLFGIDSDGASDSAGKRGCGALFISYLFGLAGGGAWDAENPLVFRGNKALKFLQDPRNASASGWECVSAFFGKPIASLWRDFCLDMNKQTHFPMPGAMAVDAFTGEPSGLDPFMGHYEYGAWSINLAGPAREPDTGTILLTAWSARYAEPFTCGGKGIIRYQSLNHEAEGFISIGLLHL